MRARLTNVLVLGWLSYMATVGVSEHILSIVDSFELTIGSWAAFIAYGTALVGSGGLVAWVVHDNERLRAPWKVHQEEMDKWMKKMDEVNRRFNGR